MLSLLKENASRGVTSVCALLLLAGCGSAGKSSEEIVTLTKQSWASDAYVPITDSRTGQLNSSRILSMQSKPANRVMQVGSIKTVIHAEPHSQSRAIGVLSFGDAVRVLQENFFVRTSFGGDMKEYITKDGGDTTPSWVQIQIGDLKGWVVARSLSTPLELATSSEAQAQERAKRAAGSSGKGFSEKVKRQGTAMKGAAGTPKLKGANYEAADAILAKLESPANLSLASRDPFTAVPRLLNLPPQSRKLAEVDPALAAKVAQASAQTANPKSEGGGGIGSALGALGLQDSTSKAAAKAVEVLSTLMQSNPITPVEERVLGRECLALCIGDSKVLAESDPIASYVRWVGAKVAANATAPYPALGLDFIVMKDDGELNAMAVPGGPILITTGMLKFLESEAELAAILAHEVGHVEERHGLWRASQNGMDKWASLLSLLDLKENGMLKPLINDMIKADGLTPELQALVSDQVLKNLDGFVKDIFEGVVNNVMEDVIQKGDQGLETCADFRGMALASAAGYNPNALKDILARLKGVTGNYGGAGYSESRLTDADSVIPYLPSSQSKSNGSSSATAAANWKRMDELLSSGK